MRAAFLPLIAVCALATAPAGLASEAKAKPAQAQIQVRLLQVCVRPDAWKKIRELYTPDGPQLRSIKTSWRALFAAMVASGQVGVLGQSVHDTNDGAPLYFEVDQAPGLGQPGDAPAKAAGHEKYRVLVLPRTSGDKVSVQISIFRGIASGSSALGEAVIGSGEITPEGVLSIRLGDDPAEPLLLLTAIRLPSAP